MGDLAILLSGAWIQSPAATKVFVLLIGVVLGATILSGSFFMLQWRGRAREIRLIEQKLHGSVHQMDHRALYREYGMTHGSLERTLLEVGRKYPWFRAIAREVEDYHRRQIGEGDGGWTEVLERFLDRPSRRVSALRQTPGLVVLLGLAGTVVGFMEALPALKEAFTPDSEGMTAGSVIPVLADLSGVFLATLAGVVVAFLLHLFSSFPQGSLASFSSELDGFGARWLVPVMKAPENLLEQKVQEEVSDEFKRLGVQLQEILQPIVDKLALALESLPQQVERFSSNIRSGEEILQEFHGAVRELGGSAKEAVENLSGVVTSSQEFIREIPRLQGEGRQEFLDAAEQLVEPVREVKVSTGYLTRSAEELSKGVGELKTWAAGLLDALTRQAENLSALADPLRRLADSVPGQGERLDQVAGSLERLAESHDGLVGRLEDLVKRAEAASQLDIVEIVSGMQGSLREAVHYLGARQEQHLQRIGTLLAGQPDGSDERKVELLQQIHREIAGLERFFEQQTHTLEEIRLHLEKVKIGDIGGPAPEGPPDLGSLAGVLAGLRQDLKSLQDTVRELIHTEREPGQDSSDVEPVSVPFSEEPAPVDDQRPTSRWLDWSRSPVLRVLRLVVRPREEA